MRLWNFPGAISGILLGFSQQILAPGILNSLRHTSSYKSTNLPSQEPELRSSALSQKREISENWENTYLCYLLDLLDHFSRLPVEKIINHYLTQSSTDLILPFWTHEQPEFFTFQPFAYLTICRIPNRRLEHSSPYSVMIISRPFHPFLKNDLIFGRTTHVLLDPPTSFQPTPPIHFRNFRLPTLSYLIFFHDLDVSELRLLTWATTL